MGLKCRVGTDDVEEAQLDYVTFPAVIRFGVDDVGVTLTGKKRKHTNDDVGASSALGLQPWCCPGHW